MLKIFASITFILLMTSCRQSKELKYTTETLDCLKPLLEKQNKGNDEEVLIILNQYSKDFKFASDLKSNFTDKTTINKAEQAAISGDLTKAKSIIENRIIERGFSETLEQSINNINKAIKLQKYIESSNTLDIPERVRAFAELKAHTEADYKDIPDYRKWLKREADTISEIAKNDKLLLIQSYSFLKDYIALNNPPALGILLLELADAESTSLVKGSADDIKQSTLNELNSKGLSQTVSNSYSSTGKSLKQLENNGIGSLQDQLIKTHLLAKAGQISKTLESLQELQDLCEIDEKFRRRILKDLFLAKGWNDASLINRDFLDISYLLETVYKANQ